MVGRERRLVAIMFTDMVGYTTLGQRNETLSLALVEEQRKIIRPVLAKHGGREVKTIGDAFLAEFPSTVDAVRCAYDIQRGIREFSLSLPPENRVHLRIGIHVGEVVESVGDISGDAVNVASRIEPLAADGGVCLSRQAYDHVQRKVDFRFSSLGTRNLKNVIDPVEVFRMVMPWEERSESTAKLDRRRIAVLPFANMSPDTNDSYFADGVTDEIISTVSGISGLRVISRTSAMRYRDTSKLLKEIGKELEVGSVLEGSFRKAGNRVRITAQLIDVSTDEHLWAETYDRELGDVFSVQSDVARRVADALRVKVLPQEQNRIDRIPTGDSEAHSHYLRGKYLWNQRSREGLLSAIELFQAAITIDPNFSLPYSGISDCYLVLGDHRHIPYAEAFSKAKEYASRAVELDPASAEAHTSLAEAILYQDRDVVAAAREFEKSIAVSPSYATTYHWYGISLSRQGRLKEALENALRAQRLDPLSPQIASFVGLCHLWLGDYDLAEKQQLRALELQPGFVPAITNLRYTYLTEKKYTQAVQETMRALELTKDELDAKLFLAAIYAVAGKEAEARKAMADAETLPNPNNLLRNYRSIYHAALGETERAVELVQLDYEAHADWIGEIDIDPLFAPIRAEPRVRAMLKEVKGNS